MTESVGNSNATLVYVRILGYLKPYWLLMVLASLGLAVTALAQTGFVALIQMLLDGAFIERNPETIKIMPWLIIGLFLIKGMANFLALFNMQYVGRQVIKKMRGEVFDRFLQLPTSYYDKSSSGVLVSKLTYNIEQIAESVTKAFTILLRDSLMVIGLLSYMFYLHALLSTFMLLVGPALALIVRFVGRRFRRFSMRIQNSMGDVTRTAEEVVQGHRVVKIFGGQEVEEQRFEELNEHNRFLHMKMALTKAASTPMVELIASFGIGAIIYVATLGGPDGQVQVGEFVAFLSAMMLMMPPLKHLTDINEPLQRGIAAGTATFDLLSEVPEKDTGTRKLENVQGEVEFRDVYFAYTEEKGDVLNGISFIAPAGKSVALVGRSGSGKSTLVSLLPRFYDLDRGSILIDNTDIRDITLASLRSQIALVSQDIVLFNDTIGHNIAYGSLQNACEDDIWKAVEAAQAMEFINKLPQKMDTLVGDRGVLLSGGQRQRIAIARALLKDAPILILDEATSALDTESERAIQEALELLMQNRATFVIAHRLSTVENADSIMVLDHGRVVETGNHDQLLEQNGLYAALYKMQFEDKE